jgi:hypothetical protein
MCCVVPPRANPCVDDRQQPARHLGRVLSHGGEVTPQPPTRYDLATRPVSRHTSYIRFVGRSAGGYGSDIPVAILVT